MLIFLSTLVEFCSFFGVVKMILFSKFFPLILFWFDSILICFVFTLILFWFLFISFLWTFLYRILLFPIFSILIICPFLICSLCWLNLFIDLSLLLFFSFSSKIDFLFLTILLILLYFEKIFPQKLTEFLLLLFSLDSELFSVLLIIKFLFNSIGILILFLL